METLSLIDNGDSCDMTLVIDLMKKSVSLSYKWMDGGGVEIYFSSSAVVDGFRIDKWMNYY